MFNNVIGKIDTFFSDGSSASAAGPSGSGTSTSAGDAHRPEDIPREELLQLCMKMNTRMKAMESKYKEVTRKRNALANERVALVQSLEAILQTSLSASHSAEVDLDLPSIQSHVEAFETLRRSTKQATDECIRRYERELVEAQNRNTLLSAMLADSNSNNNGSNNSTAVETVKREAAHSGEGEGESGKGAERGGESLNALLQLNSTLQQQIMSLEFENKDLRAQCQQSEDENQRLKNAETLLREQIKSIEVAMITRNNDIEALQKEKTQQKLQFEEKAVALQLQLQKEKQQRDETQSSLAKRYEEETLALCAELESAQAKLRALTNQKEEKEMLLESNKEMVLALQQRLMQIEPQLATERERANDLERQLQSTRMLRVEQDALSSSLNKDLQSLREEKESLSQRVRELEDVLLKNNELHAQVLSLQATQQRLQSDLDEKSSTITRMRSEMQTNEHNHAMRTAMLAACEAQLEEFQREMQKKDHAVRESVEKVSALQVSLAAAEQRLAERVEESHDKIRSLEKLLSTEKEQNDLFVQALKQEQAGQLESAKKDFAKKSAMARQLLSEREEEVRVLSAKVQELQEEIASGAPTERKIFELAKEQSKRDAMNAQYRDNRELAFQQLQHTLAVKDFELAQTQQRVSDLNNEVVELRKIKQREGINMDYLKNVVVQYMTLAPQSSEKLALVPVLAMLLQFSPKEMLDVQRAIKDPQYGVKPVKEVKRTDLSSLFSFGSASSSASTSVKVIRPPAARPTSSVPQGTRTSSSTASTSLEVNASPQGTLRVSLSDLELQQKLKGLEGDILDMSISHDELDVHHLSMLHQFDEEPVSATL